MAVLIALIAEATLTGIVGSLPVGNLFSLAWRYAGAENR